MLLISKQLLFLFYHSDGFFFLLTQNSSVDTVHYITILLWVCGNVTWALGEFFFAEYDEPIKMWRG